MNEVKFSCPSCAQHLECDDAYAGDEINCPHCQHPVIVPATVDLLSASDEAAYEDPNESGDSGDDDDSTNPPDPKQPSRVVWMIAGGIAGLAIGGAAALFFANSLLHRPVAESANIRLKPTPAEISAGPSAPEILGKVGAFYHALNTFGAVDHQETVVDTANVDVEKLAILGGSSRISRPGQPIIIDCELEMAKPGFYRITWVQSVGTNVVLRGGAWSSGQGDFVYRWPANNYFKTPDRASALGAVPGFMGVVVNGFFGLPGNRLGAVNQPTRIKDEAVGSRDCYVVTGTLDGDRVIIWVAKADFQLVQIKMVANAGALSFSEEEIIHSLKNTGRKVTPESIAEMKDAVTAMSAMRGSFTESYQLCRANQPAGERAFIFDIPDGATFLTGTR